MRTPAGIKAQARNRQRARDEKEPRSVLGKKRPAGIVLLSLLVGAASMTFLYLAATLNSLGTLTPVTSDKQESYMFFVWCESITGIVGSAGLWFLAEWARVLMVIRAVVSVVYQLSVNATQNITGALMLQVLLMVAVMVYLLQPDVRKAFAP